MEAKVYCIIRIAVLILAAVMATTPALSVAQVLSIDRFEPEMLATFTSTDPGQFFGRSLTGFNMDTDPPGLWRVIDGKLDPPQGTYLDGVYCPMFEQIIDHRMLKDVRIKVTFFTGVGPASHPGILFRGKDADNFGWLYVRPHSNGSDTAVVLSSASVGFWSQSPGSVGGPHFEGLAGFVSDVGFNRDVELVLEIFNDKLSVDINGERRISGFDISGAGYAAEGMSGVAICDNHDPATAFLRFSVTPLPLTVPIDIKPGSFPNSINLGSGGTVAVAIFSTSAFDATTVDPMSVTLAGASVQLKGKGTPMSSFQDVNGDGLPDLVVHVTTEALQLSDADTEAVLEGRTFDGLLIRGVDTVRIVP